MGLKLVPIVHCITSHPPFNYFSPDFSLCVHLVSISLRIYVCNSVNHDPPITLSILHSINSPYHQKRRNFLHPLYFVLQININKNNV